MSESNLTDFLLLPKLKLSHFEQGSTRQVLFHCTVESLSDFCPHCGLETNRVHDRRKVKIKDAPHGTKEKYLIITKKRFRCLGMGCKRVFTESVDGIYKRAKITERMQRSILYICDNFANMKAARKHLRLGNKTIYKRHYSQLEMKWREKKNDPWPTTIGIDEHSFIRNKKYGHREFVTMKILTTYFCRDFKTIALNSSLRKLILSIKRDRYIPKNEYVLPRLKEWANGDQAVSLKSIF